MDKRTETGRTAQNSSSQLRKGKKRGGRKSNAPPQWADTGKQGHQNESYPQRPAAEYGNMFWQQSGMRHQPLMTPSGQRLYAAVSDPSVCGYSPIPMTFAMEPVSLPPMYQLYQPVPRPGYRTLRGKPRRNYAQNHSGGSPTTSAHLTNGYSSLQENNLNSSAPAAYQNGDYASLPPTANNDNGTGGEELSSEQRRYSDPGLGPAEIPARSQSDDSESLDSGSSITTIGRSSKLVLSLIEQVTALKESNSQLFKEVHDAKSELDVVKSELGRLQQISSTDYQPGMLSDIVREMREATKVREEALISKVKAMMDDKPAPRSAELDELRNHLAKMTEEKASAESRLVKLEEEIASLKLSSNNEGREIATLEEETLVLRRELQEARASRTVAENHAAKLEKLVGILRKKMSGASAEETVADIRELVASGLNPTSGSNVSPKAVENHSSEENNDTFSSSNADSTTASSDNSNHNSNSPSRNNSFSNSNTSLSGPVTDL